MTTIDEGRRVFLPLRMVLLLSEFYLFLGAVNSYADASEVSEPAEGVVPMFGQFMQRVGMPLQVGRESGSELPLALLGNAAVRVERERRISILDFNDYPLPDLDPVPVGEHPVIRSSAFVEHHGAFERERTLVTQLALDVISDAAI